MGRFNTLEFGAAPEPAPERAAPGRGEVLKDAQFFLDDADRMFYRMEYEPALKNYSRAAGIDPGALGAWRGQVFSLIELEEYQEAVLWIGKANEIIGEHGDLLALRALAAARTGDFDRACGYSDAALESVGTGALPYVVRGEIFLYGRRNGELSFEQACSLDGSWQTRILIADACLFSHKRNSAMLALKFLHTAWEQNPNRPELYLRLAQIRAQLKDYDGAREALEQAAMLDRQLLVLPKLMEELRPRGFWSRLLGRG